MAAFNLDNRQFTLLDNSEHGAVSDQTVFQYHQTGDIITATYTGGGVQEGQIMATFITKDKLDMRYHCIMDDDTLKAGKALAQVIRNADALIELHLDWQWLGEDAKGGKSVYIEKN